MRPVSIIMTMLFLAACGADGAPVKQTAPGVSVGGEARIGVTGTL